MANGDCCQLVGSFTGLDLDGCIISVNMSSRAELIKECGGEVLFGPTTGTVSITGYAVPLNNPGSVIHVGCPGKAGVSIPWVRRYDCGGTDNSNPGTVYLIQAGQGSSYVSGDIQNLAQLNIDPNIEFTSVSASSSSGPASIYMYTTQKDGYGLNYTGGPIAFNSEDSMVFSNFLIPGGPALYLQNFSLETNPGEIPVANYSFMFVVGDDVGITS